MDLQNLMNEYMEEGLARDLAASRQRWLDNDIHEIASGILAFIQSLSVGD